MATDSPGSQLLRFARTANLSPEQLILEAARAFEHYAVFNSLLAEIMTTGQFTAGDNLLRFIRACLNPDPRLRPADDDPRLALVMDKSAQVERAYILLQSAADALIEVVRTGRFLEANRANELFLRLYRCVSHLADSEEFVDLGFRHHFHQFIQA